MKNIFKPVLFGILSLFLSVGVYNGQYNVEVNLEQSVITNKREATHTSNYSAYTYSGSYYNSINITSLTDNIGGTLRKALTKLVYPKGWHEYYSDDTGTLSDKLQKSDADPTNSSNMVYFYTRNSVTKTPSNGGDSWNREHVWPQSLSNGHWGTDAGAGADIFHIRPVYSSINSSRSNKPFAEFSGGTKKTHNGMTYGYFSGNYFKPLAANKGDVARILMYIYVTYYDAYSSSRPNLLNVIDSYDTLLEWHCNDKPDQLEGKRNNYVYQYTNQKNRNPFVDHPEYAWHIFGNKCSSSVLEAAKEIYPDETTSTSGGSSGSSSSGTGKSPSEGALKGAKQATYDITSTSEVTSSGDVPTGSSATYSSTYSRKYQLTSGNSMTLTLKGYTNMIVKGITFGMKSNTSGGAGSLLVKAGDTNLKNMDA
jgi:endonuclease I